MLNYSAGGDAPTWDPAISVSNTIQRELPIIETLLNYVLVDQKTGKHELQPGLAESWEMTDPKTVTLKLRKAVKFHDGSDFNADVAKWSLERARDHPKSAGKRLVEAVQTFEVLDPSTLRLKLNYQSAIMLYNLTFATGGPGSTATMILSKAAFDKGGDEVLDKRPPGTGEMMIVDWKRDETLQAKRFDGYWGKGADGQPLPYLDGINVRVVPDASVTLVEMRAGSIDISAQIAARDYEAVQRVPELDTMLLHWAVYSYVFGFNQKNPLWGNNLKLRQAAMYAVDRKSLAEVAAASLGEPNDYVYWGPGMPGYDPSLPSYKFDLQKAKQLVKEAGYSDKVEGTLTTFTGLMYRRPAEIAQAMWATAGLKINLDIADMTAQRAKIKAGNFEISLYQAGSSLDPLHYFRAFSCGGSGNWSNYCNPEADKCMQEGERVYESAERDKIFKRCQQLLYEDAGIGGLHRERMFIVFNKKVKGVGAQTQSADLRYVWLDK